MSVQATTAVWEHSAADGPDLLVMLAIADAANAEGRNAHPGQPRLRKYARKGKSAVQRSIARSIARGELIRTAEAYRTQAAVYDVCLPGLAAYEEKGRADAPHSDEEREARDDGKGRVRGPKGARLATSAPITQPATSNHATAAEPREGDGTSKPRPRDPLWDALIAERLPEPTTASERGRWNKALKELRQVDATAGDVRTRCREYRRRWPGIELTPTALAANWSALKVAPRRRDTTGEPRPFCEHGEHFKTTCDECKRTSPEAIRAAVEAYQARLDQFHQQAEAS